MWNRNYIPLCNAALTYRQSHCLHCFWSAANSQRYLRRCKDFEMELRWVSETCSVCSNEGKSALGFTFSFSFQMCYYAQDLFVWLGKKIFFWRGARSLSSGMEVVPPVRLTRLTCLFFLLPRFLRTVVIIRLPFYLSPLWTEVPRGKLGQDFSNCKISEIKMKGKSRKWK